MGCRSRVEKFGEGMIKREPHHCASNPTSHQRQTAGYVTLSHLISPQQPRHRPARECRTSIIPCEHLDCSAISLIFEPYKDASTQDPTSTPHSRRS